MRMLVYVAIFKRSSVLCFSSNLIFPDDFLTIYRISTLDVMSSHTVASSLLYFVTVCSTFEWFSTISLLRSFFMKCNQFLSVIMILGWTFLYHIFFEVYGNDLITTYCIFWQSCNNFPCYVGAFLRFCVYCGQFPSLYQWLCKRIPNFWTVQFVWYHSYAVHFKVWFRNWCSLNKNNSCGTINNCLHICTLVSAFQNIIISFKFESSTFSL